MTLFEQCVEAATQEVGRVEMIDAPQSVIRALQAKRITRAILRTLADHSPSIRAQDEMRRVLGEAGE